MEPEKSNVEIIEKFIDNERKSKAWTIFTVLLFSLMACLVLFFAVKLRSTSQQLDITKDSLQIAYDRQDSLISLLKSRSLSSDRNADNCSVMYDSLQKAYDAMALVFNKSQEQVYHNDKAKANAELVRISNEVLTNKDPKLKDQVTKAVIQTNTMTPKPVGDFLVFIQCMPGYEDKTDKISQLLKPIYRVQPKQIIGDFTFDPWVKYYKDDDAAAAQKIAAMINRSDPFFKDHPAVAKKLDLKTSAHQVEVWVGVYKKVDPKLFLQKSIPLRTLKVN